MRPPFFLLTMLLLFGCNAVNSQTTLGKEKPSDKVDQLLAKYTIKDGPGISVAVIKDGAVVYKNGFGLANLEYETAITSSTVFHIASVSKQFTVFAILLLEEEGKLSLDDDVRKYLPEIVDYGHKITLRNLANHTSGIRDNTALSYLIGTSEADMFSQEQAVKLIINQKGLNFIPGDAFEYCNSGYILLAEIVKRVSGQSFAEFTQERIFKPLKMNNSQFIDDPEIIVKNRAYSYHKFDNSYYKSSLGHSFVGSTGLNTSLDDLSLWALNFEKKTVGNDAIFNKMKANSKLNSGEIIPYGLGLENKIYKGLNVLFHGGGDADYGSYLLSVPEHDFSVLFLCNSHFFHPLDFVYTIVDYYLNEKEIVATPKTALNKSLLQNFVGDYEIFPGYVVSIRKENDTLFHLVKGDYESNKVKLVQISDYEFIYPALPHSKFVFDNAKGQRSGFVKWHLSDFSYKGLRIELKAFDKEKINLNEFVGLYYNSELNTSYHLVIAATNLLATHGRNSDAVLTAFQPDYFVSTIGAIEFIRDTQHKVIGFYLLTKGIRRMKFERKEER